MYWPLGPEKDLQHLVSRIYYLRVEVSDLSFCVSGFVRPMLCTASMVQDYVVHQRATLCQGCQKEPEAAAMQRLLGVYAPATIV